jgi:hypothetical protein
LDDKTKIEIPLEGDQLKVDAASLPEGFALKAVKP